MSLSAERTYVMIKPDGVQRGLVGNIISRFEKRGFKLSSLKVCLSPRELMEEHYRHLKEKSYFAGVVDYMTSGPIVSMVWEGNDVVNQGRQMLGVTDPLIAEVSSIRGDFCIAIRKTACHASDSVEAARQEIELWFGKDEIMS